MVLLILDPKNFLHISNPVYLINANCSGRLIGFGYIPFTRLTRSFNLNRHRALIDFVRTMYKKSSNPYRMRKPGNFSKKKKKNLKIHFFIINL